MVVMRSAIIVILVECSFYILKGAGWLHFQINLSLARSLFTPLSHTSILIISSHVFLVNWSYYFNSSTSTNPSISSILSMWPHNQQNFLFCTHLFRINLPLRSTDLNRSLRVTLHIHRIISLHAIYVLNLHWPSFTSIHHHTADTCLTDSSVGQQW